ncbi:MAG: adenosylcobinamide-GDP ribazoletransferase [Akkermansia sp.]
MSTFRSTIRTIRSAFGFFTRIPVGKAPLNETMQGIFAWMPLVGIVVGLIAGACTYGASLLFPPLISGLIGCAVWVIITGGLHLDGVADCGDGLPVEVSRQRRLEIMKDSRLGTFGGTFLFFNLAFKSVALVTLASTGNLLFILMACALAGLLARDQIFIAMHCPTARPGGLGDAVHQGTLPIHSVMALLFTLMVCAWAGWHGVYALLAAFMTSFCLLRYAISRLGGVTGDVFGWLIETTEWVVLLTFCLK